MTSSTVATKVVAELTFVLKGGEPHTMLEKGLFL
jgi:hypothetical protein